MIGTSVSSHVDIAFVCDIVHEPRDLIGVRFDHNFIRSLWINYANGCSININDLVVDNRGAIKNVIIGVGGFLGVGERYIAVSFDKLKWSNEPVRTAATTAPPAGGTDPSRTVGSTSTTPPAPASSMSKSDSWYPDHATLSATKDEVKSMPEFKY